jgi:MOSC domain-containing protein YiiM
MTGNGPGGGVRLESVQVGRPRTAGSPGATDPFERPWTSAIWKDPVHRPVRLDTLGLEGDAVHDRKHHGGPHRAVLMYPADHYAAWRAEWSRKDVGPGGFGENLTVTGVTEHTICLGDVLEIGDVRLEVSSPRGPCQNLARRHGIRDLVQRVRETHRHGWYLRVLRPGEVEAGMGIRLADRPYPHWTVARAAAVRWAMADRREEAALLAACPALIPEWRERLRRG